MQKLDESRLKEVLSYDPNTGDFVRISSGKGAKRFLGTNPGRVHKTRGYREIYIDGRLYYAHRLAWLYMYGFWPNGEVDHIDGVKDNNRIENLRDITVSQNQQNRKKQGNGILGVLGVSKNGVGYKARLQVNGKEKHLGTFKTIEQAKEAYVLEKRRKHIYPNRIG